MLQRQQRCIGVAIVTVVVVSLLVMLGIQLHSTAYTRYSLTERLEDFERQRKSIYLRERFQYLGGKIELNIEENFVSRRLVIEKQLYMDKNYPHWKSNTPSSALTVFGDVYANRLFQFIQSRPLFKLLRSMPKGAALYVNGLSMVSSDYLVELSYLKDLWICVRTVNTINKTKSYSNNNNNNIGQEYVALRFSYKQPMAKNESPCKWILLKELRLRESNATVDEKLCSRFQLRVGESLNMLPQYERFVEGMLTYEPVWLLYIFRSLEEFSMDNVQYMEIHTTLPVLYNLNGGNYTFMDTARLMKETVTAYSIQNWQFNGAMIIYETPNEPNDKDYDKYLKRAIQLKYAFPTFFAGINLAKKEKSGKPLNYFARQLLAVQDKLNFFYHPDGSMDHFAEESDSILNAVLLGSKRIKHNLALLRHPELNRLIRHRNVGIEISFSTLLYANRYNFRKFRNHPISSYFAYGYPVIITSKYAPYKFNLTPLTHNYYLTFVGVTSMSVNLGTLKQLALNSIKYSSMDFIHKQKLLRSWTKKWNNWIEKIIVFQL